MSNFWGKCNITVELSFSETHADLQSWLGEIEAEIASLDVPLDCGAEQIRKQQDNAKVCGQINMRHTFYID